MLLTLGRRLRATSIRRTRWRASAATSSPFCSSPTQTRARSPRLPSACAALRTPMKIGGKEIVLTASIGIVVDDGMQEAAQDVLREGEIAMLRAKRGGADRIEIFTASMRGEDENRAAARERSQEGARRSADRGPLPAHHPSRLEPACRLRGADPLGSSDARPAWPRASSCPSPRRPGSSASSGSYVLGQALEEASRWHKDLPRERDPLFVSVNVSSRQLFRQDLVQEIRLMLARGAGA